MTKTGNIKKEVQVKLAKGLLDLIVLQLLNTQPMHGYQIITKIRNNYGVYFGPSTIYPLLAALEKKGYVNSQWNMKNERPRKTYNLTTQGQTTLNFTENSLNLLCQKIGANSTPQMKTDVCTAIPNLEKKTRFITALVE
jgi:PadR family transcriptional regulator, regulatory protein PadR